MKLRKRTLRFVAEKSDDDKSTDGVRRNARSLRRRAVEVMNYRILQKMLLIGVAIGSAVLMIFYAFVLVYNRTGRFSVTIDNPTANYAITLSETPDFAIRSAVLTNDQQVTITNMCGEEIPANVDGVNGAHNGKNYLAYTFYCKNVGDIATSMNYELTLNNVTNHIDEAIRVRVYVEGEKTDYAKTRSDGTGKEDHYCDRAFAGEYIACQGVIDKVEPSEYIRFTIVIWLEGHDEDCIDRLANGQVKFDMTINAKPPVEREQTENNG